MPDLRGKAIKQLLSDFIKGDVLILSSWVVMDTREINLYRFANPHRYGHIEGQVTDEEIKRGCEELACNGFEFCGVFPGWRPRMRTHL
jgi:hypothetical protein